jgi:hypothetical protein
MIKNTNAYAQLKDANSGDVAWKLPKRIWKDISKSELKIWIGILIYMGVFSNCSLPDYWKNNPLRPVHPIRNYISQTRFEQILRYFHIADPSEVSDSWTYKVNPLLDAVRSALMKYYTPQTNVSIDEAMIRFSGRSRDTFKMLNKPIDEGYKAICLADRGYIFDFRMPSRSRTTPEIKNIFTISEINCLITFIDWFIRHFKYISRSIIESDHYFVYTNIYL